MKFRSLVIGAFLLLSTFVIAANAQSSAAATKEYNRLVALGKSLAKIPINGHDKEPYKSLLSKNDKDIVYSEPSGEWLVRSERYWDLQKKYSKLPIAQEIAWTAANNTIPGECEGYTNCYVALMRMTEAEYLSLYPKGKYSRKAIDNLIAGFKPIVNDIGPGETYSGPGEGEERVELKKALDEISAIVKKTSQPKTKTLLAQIKKLHDAYN
ncbi:MAG TPA: hypothetical protein PKA82_16450 [Pyrinomonadaceae bacterium]|nr:hypothetical protein [Pyrinomonadaceae bacterium]